MKVILLRDVESLGSAGEVVQVKSGFARNFLIPQRQALVASDTNVAQFESKRKQHEAVSERERRAAETIAKRLEADSLTAQVRVGEEDRLFGSVTVQNIADLLAVISAWGLCNDPCDEDPCDPSCPATASWRRQGPRTLKSFAT